MRMTSKLEISAELQARVESIAERSGLSAAEVIGDALQHGHSLDWQERFLDKVAQGLASASRGEFAAPDEVARVVNKYRPA